MTIHCFLHRILAPEMDILCGISPSAKTHWTPHRTLVADAELQARILASVRMRCAPYRMLAVDLEILCSILPSERPRFQLQHADSVEQSVYAAELLSAASRALCAELRVAFASEYEVALVSTTRLPPNSLQTTPRCTLYLNWFYTPPLVQKASLGQ